MVARQLSPNILRIGSEATWVLGGQIGVALGGLVSVKVLTQLLTPYEYGRFSIANTVILLIGVNLFGPLGQGMMRYWAIVQHQASFVEYARVSWRLIKSLLYISILLSLVAGLILVVLQRYDWIWLIPLALICGAFYGWTATRLSTLVAARRRMHVSLTNILVAFAKPALAALLVFFIARDATIALLGFLIVSCGSAAAGEILFRKLSNHTRLLSDKPDETTGSRLKESILRFSTPFWIWSFFAWAHQSCDRWALLSFEGTDAVGAYTVLAQLAYYPLVFGSGFLSNFFIPIAYQRAGSLDSHGKVHAGHRVLMAMSMLYLAGAGSLILLFYLFHRQIVLLISNQAYVSYSFLLPVLTGVWSIYYFGQVLSGFGFLANRPQLYILPIVFSGILATTASFGLASNFGIIGIIWALGISGCVYAAWCLFIAKKLILSPMTSSS